jgi:hypothetical protein
MQTKTPVAMQILTRAAALLACVSLLAISSGACSTSSPQGVDPLAAAEETDPLDLLDKPVKRRAGPAADAAGRSATVDQPVLVLPLPPAETKKTIDAKLDDWNERRAKTFRGDQKIVDGKQFWRGNDDASFKVGVDADLGHVYLWVEVQDDKVIDAESKDIMSDGVIVWLQDPKLKDVIESLPEGMAEKSDLHTEIGILFTPDGQFWRFDHNGSGLYRAGITAETRKTDEGYRVELALTLGVLGQVASLPTESIAFRVELMDGDEPGRRGEQTRMSMLPDEKGPRFALYGVGGWLPYVPAHGQPPRPGALGRWMLKEGTWSYHSFEVVPNHWLVLQDTSGFQKTLDAAKVFDKICPLATSERILVEAYQSTYGTHRAGLLLCGPRAPGGRCPKDAESRLYWVHLRTDGTAWELARFTAVTDEALPQCATAARPGGELYSDFSLLPLEMLGSSVWGVGWKKTFSGRNESLLEKGIWFTNPGLKEPYMGVAISEKRHADRHERTISKSYVYLALVDKIRGLDICEIEHIEEQYCRGFERGCSTREHGELVRVHVKLWDPHKQRFETYLQTKHRGCSAVGFDFSTRRGFMLLNEAGRLGALASPANYASRRPTPKSSPSLVEKPANESVSSTDGDASGDVNLW